jgi:hypothetical protein
MIVFDDRDSADIKDLHPFGDPIPTKINSKKEIIEIDSRDWLWENRGRLLVISVPFREGTHVAKEISHFIPILTHLKHLHKYGKVHGDIRAFNIIFKDEENGWLIDLDYGGVRGEKKYPEGFKFILTDGTRLESEDPIRKFDDYYALWQLFSVIYRINSREKKNLNDQAKKKMADAYESITDAIESGVKIFPDLSLEDKRVAPVPKELGREMTTSIKSWNGDLSSEDERVALVPRELGREMTTSIKDWNDADWNDAGWIDAVFLSNEDNFFQSTSLQAAAERIDDIMSVKLAEGMMAFFENWPNLAFEMQANFGKAVDRLDSNKNNMNKKGERESPQRVKTKPGIATGSHLPPKYRPRINRKREG